MASVYHSVLRKGVENTSLNRKVEQTGAEHPTIKASFCALFGNMSQTCQGVHPWDKIRTDYHLHHTSLHDNGDHRLTWAVVSGCGSVVLYSDKTGRVGHFRNGTKTSVS
jgi:hypothetical protein